MAHPEKNASERKPSALRPKGPTELGIVSHGFPIGSLHWFGGEVAVSWHAGPLTSLHTSLEILKEVVDTGIHVQEVIASRGGHVQGYEYLVSRKPNDPSQQ